MRPRTVLAVTAVAILLLITTLLLAPRAFRELTYVGESGVSLDGAGGRTVHINTCGEAVNRVEVEAGGYAAAYTSTAPVSGVTTFDLGAPAHDGWEATVNGELGAVDQQGIRVEVTLHDRPDTHRFRTTDVTAAELRALEPGRIAVGTPAPSGDRILSWPEDFATDCPGPVTHTPGVLGWWS